MSGSRRTRVGVIGAGNIAAIAQLPTLVKRDDVELSALSTLGYDDVLTLGYEYRWHPQDLPEPSVGFARGAKALRAMLSQPVTAESTR